jgi:two-component sensor histidine kinase
MKDKEKTKDQLKRNLRALSVMFKYQSRKTPDEDTSQLLKNMNDRLESFAQIYEKLYQYKNYSKIEFSSFVKWQTKRLFLNTYPESQLSF